MNIDFDDISTKFKCLSDPTRLRILHMLMENEYCVGDIARTIGTTQANISKHLSLLRQAGMVNHRKDGMQVIYSLSGDRVQQLCKIMCND
ncbi:ArsR/SmtB family transcription factor [Desulfurispira natronophila]|uniref:ArsR family transcriptional regulator n=1 Tax=Desulfurispira natronophila TaxID=682562 RepID=A0A7W7Y2K6_9BACT|nr:metalloregulator ArsR/SmtB family transcription factor [Desulfurispira natronophila]MBB5020935.1 ArsR family transcriptional regulator [Desulfurispira natronophila]